MWCNFILLVMFFGLWLTRWSRWLAIFQQKEYRWDRIRAYLSTAAGLEDLWRWWPHSNQLTRNGFKRPKLTVRVGLLALLSSLITLATILVICRLSCEILGLILLIMVWFLPVIIAFCNFPVSYFVKILTRVFLLLAARKISAKKPLIIGITGSYAKSSTKHLTAFLLSMTQSVLVSPRSVNTPLGVAIFLLRHYRHQPMIVLEYAAYKKGEIDLLARHFPPSLVAITGLTAQHLALFGSVDKIIEAKSELITATTPQGSVFFNPRDKGAMQIAELGQKNCPHQVLIQSYTDAILPWQYQHIGLNQFGQLHFSLGGKKVQTQLMGSHYLNVVQGAVALAKAAGLNIKLIRTGLEQFKPDRSFIHLIHDSRGFALLDDGRTANPAGFAAALQLAIKLKTSLHKKRLILVTSGMIDLGSQEESIHHQLAQAGCEEIDMVIYLDKSGKNVFKTIYQDRLLEDLDSIWQLLHNLKSNDLVWVEGRLPPQIAHYLGVSQ